MPYVIGTTSYNSAEYVLNLARSIVNDAAQGIQGDVLADSQPYTFVYLNSAYQFLQDELANNGEEIFKKEVVFTGMTPVVNIDPATQVFIYDQGYNDGGTTHVAPSLPQDLIVPLRLWERQSGTMNYFCRMLKANDGLPAKGKSSFNQYWEWRGDSIYMPGALLTTDMRLSYVAYLPDLTDGTSTVQIRRATNALAYLTAAEFALARGSAAAESLRGQGLEMIDQMTTRTARSKQRGSHRRRPFSYGKR
jgi:hypothetical protein